MGYYDRKKEYFRVNRKYIFNSRASKNVVFQVTSIEGDYFYVDFLNENRWMDTLPTKGYFSYESDVFYMSKLILTKLEKALGKKE
jgi:hypothetical protein